MCVPTLIAELVLLLAAGYLLCLALMFLGHYILRIQPAEEMFNFLMRRTSDLIQIDGRPVKFSYSKGIIRGQRPTLKLEYTGHFKARALFRAETGKDRFGKKMGLNLEVQTGDPDFDAAVYMECEDAPFITALLAAPGMKERIKELLADFTSIEFTGGTCLLTKVAQEDIAYTQSGLTSAAAEIVALSDAVTILGAGRDLTPLTNTRRRTEAVLTWVGGALLATGLFLVMLGLSNYEPLAPWEIFKRSLPAGLLFGGASVYYAYSRVRGSSTAYRTFGLSALYGGAGLFLYCWGAFMVINGATDYSAPAERQLIILTKESTGGNKNHNYSFGLAPSRSANPVYKFNVRRPEFDLLEEGDSCVLATRKGFLGYEWVAGKVCNGRGRYVASGHVGAIAREKHWYFPFNTFREIPPPVI